MDKLFWPLGSGRVAGTEGSRSSVAMGGVIPRIQRTRDLTGDESKPLPVKKKLRKVPFRLGRSLKGTGHES